MHLITLDHDQRSDAFGGQPPGHLTYGRLRPDPDQLIRDIPPHLVTRAHIAHFVSWPDRVTCHWTVRDRLCR